MDLYLLYAFGAVVFTALTCIIFKHSVEEKSCECSLLIIFHVIALILLLPFVSFSSLSLISEFEAFLLFSASFLWVIGDFFGVKAYKYMDASICEAFGTLKLILVGLIGIFLFGESLSFPTILGIGLIIGGILMQMKFDSALDQRGVICMLLNVAFISLALTLDKVLLETVSAENILFIGFLLPILLYAGLGYRTLGNLVSTAQGVSRWFYLSPVLGLVSYYLLLLALQNGSLTVTYTIQETAVLFVLLFEILILHARQSLISKLCCCASCSLGAVVICLV